MSRTIEPNGDRLNGEGMIPDEDFVVRLFLDVPRINAMFVPSILAAQKAIAAWIFGMIPRS